jgi:hypothetical protein
VISTLLVGGVGTNAAQAQPSTDILTDVPVNSRALILDKPYWVVPDNDPERTLDADPTSDYPASFLNNGVPVDTDNDGVIDYLEDLDLNSDNDTDDNGEMAQFYGPKKKYVSFTFDGGQDAIATQVSYLRSDHGDQSKLCESWSDTTCRSFPGNPNADLTGFVNLAPCSQGVEVACIEGIRVGSGANLTQGTFSRLVDNSVSADMRTEATNTEIQNSWSVTKFQDDGTAQGDLTTWEADSTLKLPAGSSPSLWTVPGQTNVGGSQTYMARASLLIGVSDGVVSFNEFSAEIVPFVEVTETDGYDDRDLNNDQDPTNDPLTFEPPIWYERDTNPSGNASLGVHHRPMLHPSASFSESTSIYTNPVTCAWEELDKCGVAVRFASGAVGELTVRIPKSLGGWFHGRLSEAHLSMVSYSNDLNRLVVSGKSVDVPVTSAYFPLFAQNGAATTSYQQYWQDDIATWDDGDSLESYRLAEEVNRGGMATASWWAPDSSGSLDDFIRYFPALDEEAKGLNNAWRFATLPAQGTDHACFADKSRIQGMITTNAMVYQAGLPTLEGGKFKYQVAGVHKNYDGSIFSGKYDLVMRADDARCLYGLPLVVPDANVSVKDSLGNTKSFQSSVTLDGEWLEIHASDFTFSVPSIEVEFREFVAPTVASPQVSTPSKSIEVKAKAKIAAKKQLKVKSALSANSLRFLTKVKAKPGDKVSISLQTGKKKNVDLRKSYIYFKKPGTYVVKVQVDRKKGPTITKYLRVTVKK